MMLDSREIPGTPRHEINPGERGHYDESCLPSAGPNRDSDQMSTLPPTPEDWTLVKLERAPGEGGSASEARSLSERRERRAGFERRHRLWWSFLYGSVRPRRRRPPRRMEDSRFHAVDWYGAHLWGVSIAILILSVADAFLTLTLISGGAVEVNPIMAMFIGRNVAVFVGLKIAMTGGSVVLLVFLARYRFMRLMRVEMMLYAVLTAYILLMIHEWRMLQVLGSPQIL
jgi:hypothetical protein